MQVKIKIVNRLFRIVKSREGTNHSSTRLRLRWFDPDTRPGKKSFTSLEIHRQVIIARNLGKYAVNDKAVFLRLMHCHVAEYKL